MNVLKRRKRQTLPDLGTPKDAGVQKYEETVTGEERTECPKLYPQLNIVDCLRLRNITMEIIEELKIRRNNDVENEERIKCLAQEKYELERKYDNEVGRVAALQEQHQMSIVETEKKFEEKMRKLEGEVKHQITLKECADKEINALKDDYRKLQLMKYSLEKKLKDQDRRLQLQVHSTEQHLGQLSEAEQTFQSLSVHCKQLTEAQSRLDKNVKEATKLNKELMYINKHQKCMIKQQEIDIKDLQSKLVTVNSQLKQKPDNEAEYEQTITALKNEVQRKDTQHGKLCEEYTCLESKHQETLQRLQDSHKLIDRHLQNTNIYKEEITLLQTHQEEHKMQLSTLKSELEIKTNDLTDQRSLHNEAIQSWELKEKELKVEIERLEEDLCKQKETSISLEDLNSSWSHQNMQLSKQLKEAETLLNKETTSTELQTILSMLDTKDSQCQTQVESALAAIQTCLPECSSTSCQTMLHSTASVPSQTKVPALSNLGAQTDMSMTSKADQTTQTKITFISHMDTTQTENDKNHLFHLGAHIPRNSPTAESDPLQMSNNALLVCNQRGNDTKSCKDADQENMRTEINDILIGENDGNRAEKSSNSSVLIKPNSLNGEVAEIQSSVVQSHSSVACVMESSCTGGNMEQEDNVDGCQLRNLDKNKCKEDLDQRNLGRDCSEGLCEMSDKTMNLGAVDDCAKDNKLKKDPTGVLDGSNPLVLNMTSIDSLSTLGQYAVDDTTKTTKVQNLGLLDGGNKDNKNFINDEEKEFRCSKEMGMLSIEQNESSQKSTLHTTPQNRTDTHVITGDPDIKVTSESVPVITSGGRSQILDSSGKSLLEKSSALPVSDCESRNAKGRTSSEVSNTTGDLSPYSKFSLKLRKTISPQTNVPKIILPRGRDSGKAAKQDIPQTRGILKSYNLSTPNDCKERRSVSFGNVTEKHIESSVSHQEQASLSENHDHAIDIVSQYKRTIQAILNKDQSKKRKTE